MLGIFITLKIPSDYGWAITEGNTAFKRKLKVWTQKIIKGKTTFFSTLYLLLEDNHSIIIHVQDTIAQLFEKLTSEFNHYW
jgi:hypothetical protein